MASFVRAGGRLINLDAVVDLEVIPAQDGRIDEDGERFPARPLTALIHTVGFEQCEFGSEDHGTWRTWTEPRVIKVYGKQAEQFLGQVYIPSQNGSQPASVMAGGS